MPDGEFLQLATDALARVEREPINRMALREQHRARLEAERQAALDRIELQEVDEARKLIRTTAGKSKKADKTRRSKAWWLEAMIVPGYRYFAYEFFTRQIRGHMTPSEQAVFFLIFDRTVMWCKEWETIRLSQFVHGSLPRPDGSRLFTGTGLSERAVRDTLKRLVADGLVRRRDKPGGMGLQQYALPSVAVFRDLPRFAGKNISFRGVLIDDEGEAHVLSL